MRRVRRPAPGKLVMVNGHEMHVFSEGQGDCAIVFMSGGGTRWPTCDFKPLWSLLSDRHRIVVIEKSGYGWSEATRNSRDLDAVLDESRKALSLCGIDAPYILAPHSMSGLEAIYWAQTHPDEVKAIIGLDPAIPEAYEEGKIHPMFAVRLLRVLGVISSDMVNEAASVKANAKKVKNLPLPIDTPICFFISNGKGLLGIKNWEELLTSFVSGFTSHRQLSLKCGHYVHCHEPVKIADEINAFIESI